MNQSHKQEPVPPASLPVVNKKAISFRIIADTTVKPVLFWYLMFDFLWKRLSVLESGSRQSFSEYQQISFSQSEVENSPWDTIWSSLIADERGEIGMLFSRKCKAGAELPITWSIETTDKNFRQKFLQSISWRLRLGPCLDQLGGETWFISVANLIMKMVRREPRAEQ